MRYNQRARILRQAMQEAAEIPPLKPITAKVADVSDAAAFPEIARAIEHAKGSRDA